MATMSSSTISSMPTSVLSAMPTAAASNGIFDPYIQTITILMADGVTPIQIGIADLDSFSFYNLYVCINFGAQLGASAIMLVILLLITKESKRKTPIFGVNVVSLIFAVLRALFQVLYWAGPFAEIYDYISGDYSNVPQSAFRNSVAAIVAGFALLSAVEVSLLLQIHILFKGLQKPLIHKIMIAISGIVALLPIGFRFASMVLNSRVVIEGVTSTSIVWIASATLITETISIWYFCLVFMGKLIYHIMRQRQMNATVYKPLQILSIMSGNTMIIPSIFAILEYFPNSTFPEAGSMAITLVAIMLPLSSTWASASIDDPAPPLNFGTASYNRQRGSCSTAGATNDHTNRFGTAYDRKASIGMAHLSPSNNATAEHSPIVNRAMPLGRSGLGKASTIDSVESGEEVGVMVERGFSVRSGPTDGSAVKN